MKKNTVLIIIFLWLVYALMPNNCFAQENQKAISSNTFLVLTIENEIISPLIADYISDGIDEAEEKSYAGAIIQMDTPGGLLESTRSIVKKIINAQVPVIVYVAPGGSRAGSAGVFITMASHVAAMAPSTNIGAAHPVAMGEGEKEDRGLKELLKELLNQRKPDEKKNHDKRKKDQGRQDKKAVEEKTERAFEDKILKDTLAWIKTISQNRNRNATWAQEAVLKSSSLTEQEALEANVINFIAKDLNDLLRQLDGITFTYPDTTFTLNTKNAVLVYKDLTLRQHILNTLINPNIAYLLMLFGFLGLFIEITHPGAVFPGIIGIISLIIAFYAFQMLPVNYAGILLIVLALILFIAEALTPLTFGLLTLGGLICMLIGSLMLIDTPFALMKVSLKVILPVILAIASIMIFLVTNIIRTYRRKAASGKESLIGEIATAETSFRKEGQIFVQGELWTAINQDKTPIRKGEQVKIIGVDKIKLLVSKYEVK